MTVSGGDIEQDLLERLLADVQRTIRENDQFILNLKAESLEPDSAPEEIPDTQGGDFEEL